MSPKKQAFSKKTCSETKGEINSSIYKHNIRNVIEEDFDQVF